MALWSKCLLTGGQSMGMMGFKVSTNRMPGDIQWQSCVCCGPSNTVNHFDLVRDIYFCRAWCYSWIKIFCEYSIQRWFTNSSVEVSRNLNRPGKWERNQLLWFSEKNSVFWNMNHIDVLKDHLAKETHHSHEKLPVWFSVKSVYWETALMILCNHILQTIDILSM